MTLVFQSGHEGLLPVGRRQWLVSCTRCRLPAKGESSWGRSERVSYEPSKGELPTCFSRLLIRTAPSCMIMGASFKNSNVRHRGCFYLSAALASMPTETVVTPHLADYLEQVSIRRLNASDNPLLLVL